jgi:hypothetical protein
MTDAGTIRRHQLERAWKDGFRVGGDSENARRGHTINIDAELDAAWRKGRAAGVTAFNAALTDFRKELV